MQSERQAGILFDLDGVLIDSEHAHYEATRLAFSERQLPELSAELYQALMLGRPDREAIAAGLAALAIPLHELEPLLEAKARFYRELVRAGAVELLEDGLATLEAALRHGYPVAVVTGALADEAEWALRAAGVRERVPVLVSAEDVTRGKPDPEPYLLGCTRLGTAPQQSIAIEDSPAGVTAGRAAGLRVLAVARRPFPELARADRVVHRLGWDAVAALLAQDD
ncbi:HAD family phosphatase [Thermomicrobium sp. 4228-Ro]|uniref:HAD family hydrolase n=1 Tax=Thermomicrobium sp. 4228-Ro TaxID=2993937 RepID=UPI0022496D75|nr:HAD family phosphatase [Thermomicrobium sp. 4228-Ro]MCX2726962.1 HAD family phosphatase [Thermomicrobium sp. 4228-Ro]